MGWGRKTFVAMGVLAAAGAADAQQKQVVTGPVAVYWVSAQTSSGMAALMGGMGGPQGGARRPSMGAMMGMMMGGGLSGGGQAQKSLLLQLGSSRAASGAPSAEHLPPAGLGAGPSLPLVTPKVAPPEREPPSLPPEYQKPKGRMLIYWGCGERARPGQPITIDFSQLTPEAMKAGKVPAGWEALSKGFALNPMRGPAPSRNTTYGDWPNERSRATVPGQGSLVGEHTIRGNYSPEIRFSLAQNQDFLGPLNIAANRGTPSGANFIGWRPVTGAQAYLATTIGGGRNETVVLWTSSEVQASAFSLPDYISPADLTRLVEQKALMAPSINSCVIPREVIQAAPEAMLQLAAYGGEANFVYPPRPADPKVAWNQQWQVKVRYRSATSAILGMDEGGMGGMGGQEEAPSQRPRMPFGIPRL